MPILYFTGLQQHTKHLSAIRDEPAVLCVTPLPTHLDTRRAETVTSPILRKDAVKAVALPVTVPTVQDISHEKTISVSVRPHKLKRASTSEAIAAFETLSETSSADVDRQLLGNFTITAYALTKQSTGKTPGQAGFGITSSGTHASVGRTVAVDPSVIPIGSLVYIDLPGVGWRIAEDTGGAIRGHHIDLLMPSDGAAMQFGVKHKVIVYAMPR